MKLVAAHARVLVLELVRYPAYVVPTLLFPAAFFLVFAPPHARLPATIEMTGFAAFAVIGVAFFQFGVGIAADRGSAWEAYLRTLPVAPLERLVARVLSAVPFACGAAALVVVAASATTAASLPVAAWFEFAAVLAVGLVPFALLGLALGYLAPPRGALPIANLLYLGLAYGGGLWLRPSRLPAGIAAASPYLPTRAFADALAGAVSGRPFIPGAALRLGAFALAFGALAVWAYRRDEGRRYR